MAQPIELVLSADTVRFVKGLEAASKALKDLSTTARVVQGQVNNAINSMQAAFKAFAAQSSGALSGLTASAGKFSAAFGNALSASEANARQAIAAFSKMEQAAGAAFNALGAAAVAAATQVRAANQAIATSTNNAANAANRATRTLSRTAGSLNSAMRGGFDTVGQAIEASVSQANRAATNIAGAAITIGGALTFKKVISDSSEFGKALAYVGTIASDAGVPLGEYRDKLLSLSGQTSKDLIDLTRGLYFTLSAGIPSINGASGAFAVLEQSQKAAVAGIATTEEAVTAITGVLNAYSNSNLTAAEVSDKLFQTVNRGVIEFPQLARELGQVSGVAASFGVSIDEVLAALATITKAGIPASSAVAGIRQALVSIARPPRDVRDALAALNVEFGAVALKEKGFAGVLDEIIEKTGGSSEALVKFFTDLDGLKAVLAVAGQGLGSFKGDLDAIKNSAGSTEKSFKLLSGTLDFQLGVLRNQFTKVFVEIGETVVPQLQESFSRLARGIGQDQVSIGVAIGNILNLFIKLVEYVATSGEEGLLNVVSKLLGYMLSLAEFVATDGETILKFFFTLFSVEKIATAILALQQFIAVAKAAGAAAALRPIPLAALTGFRKAFAALGGIISSALKSPTAIAAIAAAAVVLGDIIGNVLGQILVDVFYDLDGRLADLKKEAAASAAALDAALTARSFKSAKEAEEVNKAFTAGELISFDSGQRTGKFNLSPKDAVTRAIKQAEAVGSEPAFEGVREGAAKSAETLREEGKAFLKKADDLDTLQQRVRNELVSSEDLKKQGFDSVAAVDAEIVALNKRAEAREASAQKLINSTESEIQAYNRRQKALQTAAEAEAALRKAQEEKAKKAPRQAKQEEDLSRLLLGLEKERLEAILAAQEAQLARDRDAVAERASNAEALARRLGLNELEIFNTRKLYSDQAIELDKREIELAETAANIRAQIRAKELEQQLKQAAKVPEVQVAAVRAFIAKEAVFRAQEETRVQDVTSRRARINEAEAEREADLRAKQREIDAAGQRFRDTELARTRLLGPQGGAVGVAQAIADATSEGPGKLIEIGAFKLAEAGAEVGGVLGTLAETGGTFIGTFAAVAGLVANLPEILNGIAGFLTDGLANWLDALFTGVENVIVGVIEGLPNQLDRIFSEIIPRALERLIGNLPKIVGGLIRLPFLIIYNLIVKSIPAIFVAVVKGLIQAGTQLVEFFTSDIMRSIGEGLVNIISFLFENTFLRVFKLLGELFLDLFGEFFSDLGEYIAGFFVDLAKGFADIGVAIYEAVKEGFLYVYNLFKNLLGFGGETGPDRGIATRIGNSLALSLIGKTLTGKFEDISVEDIPIVGGFLHRGGMVRDGLRDLSGAMSMMANGAQQFALGGLVGDPGAATRRQLMRVLGSDDVPAVLQAGEAVLSRVGVRAAGGEAAIAAMNRGLSPGAGPLTANVSLVGRDVAPMLQMLLSSVAIDLISPAGVTRGAVQQTVKRAPLMVRAVRGRV